MIEFNAEVEIARPVPEVFAYVTDPEKLPSWQQNTISVSREDDGPLGVGSRLREVHRAGEGELVSLVEVTEFDPHRAFALTMVEGPLPIEARITFAPAVLGTLLRFIGQAEPGGVMRLASPLLGRTLQTHLDRHCRTLKDVLEA